MTDENSVEAFEAICAHIHALRQQRENITRAYEAGKLSKHDALHLMAELIYELAGPDMTPH